MTKIHGGTPHHSAPSLCLSCRHAAITRGVRLGDEQIICAEKSAPYDRIRMHVVECSKFDDKRMPSLYDMRQIAWSLCTDLKGKSIGFLSPVEVRARKEKVRVEGQHSYDD